MRVLYTIVSVCFCFVVSEDATSTTPILSTYTSTVQQPTTYAEPLTPRPQLYIATIPLELTTEGAVHQDTTTEISKTVPTFSVMDKVTSESHTSQMLSEESNREKVTAQALAATQPTSTRLATIASVAESTLADRRTSYPKEPTDRPMTTSVATMTKIPLKQAGMAGHADDKSLAPLSKTSILLLIFSLIFIRVGKFD